MSYSRWSNSRWYTFWCSTASSKREDQIFNVDCQFDFTYAELKRDRKGCLRKVRAKYGELEDWELDGVYNELDRYMEEFIKDVENDEKLE